MSTQATEISKNTLRVRRLGIDTYSKPVIYMRHDCHICKSEGFEALSRVSVSTDKETIIASLNIVNNELLNPGEIGLSDAAWRMLAPDDNQAVYLSHPDPVTSHSHVRAKVYGHSLSDHQLMQIMQDIVKGYYDDIYLSAFITACAGSRLNFDEIVSLTKSMINVGRQLSWGNEIVVDKHCIGGLPGNRTTMIIVPIVTSFGLVMPKTSSRAITSPAGTADAMEMLAPVNLSVEELRNVIEKEGGCIIWGGSVYLSPADDILITVERQLDIDSEGQLIASVLSKKVAAGSTHVLIDIPVGPTAKVRSLNLANELSNLMITVGEEIGLNVRTKITDGSQPVGRGIGPALEAHDVLAVLRNDPGAPEDLRERSLELAGDILEISGKVPEGKGYTEAMKVLDSGAALEKFRSICEAQGEIREPGKAKYSRDVCAKEAGIVSDIDNRRLSLTAKLAGAPIASTAGIYLHVKLGSVVSSDQPLYTIYAEAPGELDYALDYISAQEDIITINPDG